MKGYRLTLLRGAVCVLLLLALSSVPWAQDAAPLADQSGNDGPTPYSLQARTIPNSNTVITLLFTLESGDTIKATQYDGGLIRMEKGETIYGFTPYLKDRESGEIAVRVFRIARVKKGGVLVGERMAEIDDLRLDGRYTRFADAELPFGIELLQVRRDDRAKETAAAQTHTIPEGGDWGEQCCVTCNGVRSCGCAIVTSCGDCCIGRCCK
jgi:hypothetical protein